jgi:hypothetical protein
LKICWRNAVSGSLTKRQSRPLGISRAARPSRSFVDNVTRPKKALDAQGPVTVGVHVDYRDNHKLFEMLSEEIASTDGLSPRRFNPSLVRDTSLAHRKSAGTK